MFQVPNLKEEFVVKALIIKYFYMSICVLKNMFICVFERQRDKEGETETFSTYYFTLQISATIRAGQAKARS